MAEINIERKQGNPIVWVIAGVALLALLLWFVFARGDGRDVTRQMSPGSLADSLADPAYRDDANRRMITDSIGVRVPDTTRFR